MTRAVAIARRRSGFSLLEMLLVVVILGILISISGFSGGFLERQRARLAAEELASMLRSARQYAIENSAHTRVVFADEELEEITGGDLKARQSYGAYCFFIPELPGGGSEFMPFRIGRSTNSSNFLPEFASMPFLSIPSGFVGQWTPLPTIRGWRTLHDSLELEAFVPHDSRAWPKFDRDDFFSALNPVGEARKNGKGYVSRYFFNPAKYWDIRSKNYFTRNVPTSQYPENYHQTPYPFSYPLQSTTSMPSEDSNLEYRGHIFTYDELWASKHPVRYFHEIEDYLGSYDKLGTVETSARPDRRFFDLKGIEFTPKGLTTLRWADEVVFRIVQTRNSGKKVAYEVHIDRLTGLAHVRPAISKRKSASSSGGASGEGITKSPEEGEDSEETP